MLTQELSGKKIIFFSVQTFNLEQKIRIKLEELGAEVSYFDERPSNNNFTKGIIRLKRSLYQSKIDNYYNGILAKTKNNRYDYLFVNRGEVIPAVFLTEFRKQHPECIFIFYTWDSFTNHSHPTTILNHFDRRLTFDPEDATKYNINFRPLFYLDDFKNLESDDAEHDILFLGTAHSDRYKISREIYNWAEKNNLSMYCFYYIHGRLVYFYKRLFDNTFKQFAYKDLAFKSLSVGEIISLYKKSNAVLDINHPNQKGLTMRTFEAIGARKKLITTNREVVKFPFYSKNNIEVIDRENINIDVSFFEREMHEVDDDIYAKLSIEGWLYNIFIDSEEYFWNKFK